MSKQTTKLEAFSRSPIKAAIMAADLSELINESKGWIPEEIKSEYGSFGQAFKTIRDKAADPTTPMFVICARTPESPRIRMRTGLARIALERTVNIRGEERRGNVVEYWLGGLAGTLVNSDASARAALALKATSIDAALDNPTNIIIGVTDTAYPSRGFGNEPSPLQPFEQGRVHQLAGGPEELWTPSPNGFLLIPSSLEKPYAPYPS